jgi:hypothetical protein
MRNSLLLICLVTSAWACSGGEATVPDVVGERLDLAQSHIEDAGLEYEEVGGGTFGVIDASGWMVCSQEPSSGGTTDEAVKLIVDRSCGGSEASDDETESSGSNTSSSGASGTDSASGSKKKGGGPAEKPKDKASGGRARFEATVLDVIPLNSNAVQVSWTVANVGSGAGPALCRIKIETDDEGFFNNDAAQYVDVGQIIAGATGAGTTRVTGLSADYVVDSSMLCG